MKFVEAIVNGQESLLDSWSLMKGPDKPSRNIGKELPPLAVNREVHKWNTNCMQIQVVEELNNTL